MDRYKQKVLRLFRLAALIGVVAPVAASSQSVQGTPLSYECHRATSPIRIDGKLDDPAWKDAKWTSDFIDIQGKDMPAPRFRTRVKMLWDDKYLYIAAELEEPNVTATLRKHDSVIFHDNDFEVFLKPLPQTKSYYELEINAFNTIWDLFLNKPYSEEGRPDSSWDIAGLKTAVAIQGTINDPKDRDQGWTLEIAWPLDAFASRQNVPRPQSGTVWRINLSRVEWTPGNPKEANWVWTPQGAINMHIPDRWGYLNFR
jgi:hypothetical protein